MPSVGLVNPADLPCRKQCKMHLAYKTCNTAYSHLWTGRETLMPLLHALFLGVYCSDKTYIHIFLYVCMHTHIHSLQTCQNHFVDICSVSSKRQSPQVEHPVSEEQQRQQPMGTCWHKLQPCPALRALVHVPARGCGGRRGTAEGQVWAGSAKNDGPHHLLSWVPRSVRWCHWTPQALQWWELSDQQKLSQDQAPPAFISSTLGCAHSASSSTNRSGERMNIMVNIMIKYCLNCHEKLRVISSPGL